MKDIVILEGQPAKFEAVIDGIPFPHSVWLKEGLPLMENDSINFERKEGAVTCHFPITNRTNAGTYTLKCSNDSGSVESEAKMVVNGK